MNKNEIGGKAFNLYKLKKNTKLNIPEFYIISNEHYNDILNGNIESLLDLIKTFLTKNVIITFSVRSSPIYSMPGTMDTILDVTIEELKETLYKIAYSYQNQTAKLYRKLKGIPEIYPGIIIQKMVYGNKNKYSGTGILFTRNNLGIREIYGEYIEKCTGDKLVSNIQESVIKHEIFNEYKSEFNDIIVKTETIFKEPQEIEFTIENKILYVLQCRKLQFNNLTYLHILNDLFKRHIITEKEQEIRLKTFLQNKTYNIIIDEPTNYITGKIASSGVLSYNGNNVLIKNKILNEDLELLNKSEGVITFEGSLTSHPAILCRNLNIPYIILDTKYKEMIKQKKHFIIDAYNGKIIFDENINIYVINEQTSLQKIQMLINNIQ